MRSSAQTNRERLIIYACVNVFACAGALYYTNRSTTICVRYTVHGSSIAYHVPLSSGANGEKHRLHAFLLRVVKQLAAIRQRKNYTKCAHRIRMAQVRVFTLSLGALFSHVSCGLCACVRFQKYTLLVLPIARPEMMEVCLVFPVHHACGCH